MSASHDQEIVQKFRRGIDAGDEEMIAGMGAGDVEQMALGGVDFFEIGFVGDRFARRLFRALKPGLARPPYLRFYAPEPQTTQHARRAVTDRECVNLTGWRPLLLHGPDDAVRAASEGG